MKRLKLLVLVVTGLLLAAAIITTNSASPTALCEVTPEKGLCERDFPAETTFEATAKASTFSTPVGTISCPFSTIDGKVTEHATPKATALQSEVLGMLFAFCTLSGKTGCAVELSFSPFNAPLNWTSGFDGELKPKAGDSLKVFCEKTIECAYKIEAPLDVKGGGSEKAMIVAKEEVLASAGGKLCPKSEAIIWSATYTLTSPSGPFFVADQVIKPVILCKVNETPCSEAETYGVPTSFAAHIEANVLAKLKLTITEESEATEYTVSCESSTLEGKTTNARLHPLSGELSALAFGECGGTCAAKTLKLPYTLEFEAVGSGNGTVNILTGGSGSPRLRVRCIGAYKCTYETSSISTSVTGGTPAKLSVSAVLGTRVAGESDEKCGSQVKLEGKYEFTKPEAGGAAKMWITREGI